MSIGAAEESALLSVKVDPRFKQRIQEAARENDRTLSGEVRLALKRHLQATGGIAGVLARAGETKETG